MSLPAPERSLWNAAGDAIGEALTPTIRLGVTGLSRAGKTVFITALVRALTEGARLPFFSPWAEGRIVSAVLEPQPDDALPRFDYEAHLAALSGDPPEWPQSTRRISELRLTITGRPRNALRRLIGTSRLHIDIVDYPGEWLIDLSLLDQSYAAWSAEAVAKAQDPARRTLAAAWLEFARSCDATSVSDECVAIEGARLYTEYLKRARDAEDGIGALTPGRFLMPGDLAGAPLLTFFPLLLDPQQTSPAHSLTTLLERRFESYKRQVVRPFFRDHFARLDRQIVLVDVLGALSRGPGGVVRLEEALTAVLAAFRPGTNSWLSRLFSRRIDRVLFAATKADHLPISSHDRLEAILRLMSERAGTRISARGAEIDVLAIAALRSTREAEVTHEGERLDCVAGIPMAGEVIGGVTFDGRREAVIFPGDLPADPAAALAIDAASAADLAAKFPRFRPRRLRPAGADGVVPPAPHIRLDRALEYLIGDRIP